MYMCYCPEDIHLWNTATLECTQCQENQYPNYTTFTCDCITGFVARSTGGCMPVATDCAALNFFMHSDGTCYECDSDCATCEATESNCTACADPLRTNYDPARTYDSYVEPPTGNCPYCREGRQMTSAKECFYCEDEQVNCATCANDKTCTTCKKHWTMDGNNECNVFACETGYTSVTDSANVTTCKLDDTECGTGAALVNGTCIVCDASCVVGHCTGSEPNDCTVCKVEGAEKSTTTGICVCPSKTYLNGNTCAACNADCATCSGPAHVDCLTCDAAYALADGTYYDGVGVCACKPGFVFNTQFDLCVQECPAAGEYFVDYTGTDRVAVCRSCDLGSSCLACERNTDGTVRCTTCDATHELNSVGECQCLSGYNKTETTATGTNNPVTIDTCGACDLRCDGCSGPTTYECLACDVANNVEEVIVTERTAGDADTSSYSYCQCKAGYTFHDTDGCVFADQSNTNCAALPGCEFCDATGTACLKCNDGYDQVWQYDNTNTDGTIAIVYSCFCEYPKVHNSGNEYCFTCHHTCQEGSCTGTDYNECTTCSRDREMKTDANNNSYCACKPNFIEEGTECIFETICDAYSEDPECQCSDPKCEPGYCPTTGCTQCRQPFIQVFYDNLYQCECPDRYYETYDAALDQATCVECHDSCFECSEPSEFGCVECDRNMTLVQVPEGLMCTCNGIWDDAVTPSGSCRQIEDTCSDPNCSVCTSDGCILCANDSMFIVNYICTACVFPCDVCENETTCRSCRAGDDDKWPDANGRDGFLVYAEQQCHCPMGNARNPAWTKATHTDPEYCISCGDMCGECEISATGGNTCTQCTDTNAENDPNNDGCVCKAEFRLRTNDDGSVMTPKSCEKIPDDNAVCSDWEYLQGTECVNCPDSCIMCEVLAAAPTTGSRRLQTAPGLAAGDVVCVVCPPFAIADDYGVCQCSEGYTMVYHQEVEAGYYDYTRPACVVCPVNCLTCYNTATAGVET